jgi:hypothetical protein
LITGAATKVIYMTATFSICIAGNGDDDYNVATDVTHANMHKSEG